MFLSAQFFVKQKQNFSKLFKLFREKVFQYLTVSNSNFMHEAAHLKFESVVGFIFIPRCLLQLCLSAVHDIFVACSDCCLSPLLFLCYSQDDCFVQTTLTNVSMDLIIPTDPCLSNIEILHAKSMFCLRCLKVSGWPILTNSSVINTNIGNSIDFVWKTKKC